MGLTDEELMIRYQEGDIEAFNALYQRYERRLYAFLGARVKNEDVAEVFQEVFRKVHQYRFQYDSRYPFAPWIFTVMRNQLIDFYRKNKKVELSEFDETHQTNLIDESETEIEIDLSRLSPEYQHMINMRYFEGKEFKQMAEELALTEVNVRKKLSRAIAKLRTFGRGQ